MELQTPQQWSDLTFSVEPDGSGEEFGEMDYLIEVVITTTINGRSQSVRFGTFRDLNYDGTSNSDDGWCQYA